MRIRRRPPTAGMVLADHSPREKEVEAFRTLRANLQALTTGSADRALLITSALPGEGKTVTAVNLALTCARSGARVCLVDAHLRRSSLERLVGAPGGPGLAEATAALLDVTEYVQETDFSGVFLVSGGKRSQDPSVVLEHPRMAEVLASLRERFDWVVIDAPEVLGVTDALVLAPYVDGVLLVARAGVTPARTILRARDALQGVRARLLGVVLTGT